MMRLWKAEAKIKSGNLAYFLRELVKIGAVRERLSELTNRYE